MNEAALQARRATENGDANPAMRALLDELGAV
jgi:hypothetical protein